MGELFTNVRNGRMVQKYANDPIIASYIAKGVLCLGLLVGGGAGLPGWGGSRESNHEQVAPIWYL